MPRPGGFGPPHGPGGHHGGFGPPPMGFGGPRGGFHGPHHGGPWGPPPPPPPYRRGGCSGCLIPFVIIFALIAAVVSFIL